MTHRPLRIVVAVVAALALAAWVAAAAAPAAHAAGGTKPVARTFVIPKASTAILRWTFSAAPTQGETARFQISADKRHWKTLKKVTVPAGHTRVRTTWKAASHPEKRYFRLVVAKTVKSNLVVIRVK